MKRSKFQFIFCLTLFFCKGLYAQKQLNVIVSEMFERTYLLNKWDREATPILKKLPSYYYTCPSIMLRQELKNRWQLNYGLLYSIQAQKHIIIPINQPGKTVLTYIKVPLLLQYNIINKSTGSLFFQAGPQVSFLVIEEGSIVISPHEAYEVGGAYKPVVLDGVLSFGGEIKLYKNFYYNLQLRFDHSLHNVNNLSYGNITTAGTVPITDVLNNPRSAEYNMTIGLVSGISLKIR